jgi:hypothetical protein
MILLYQTRNLKATPMTNTTVSAAGGAMPQLSLNNLIDEATGQINRSILKGLVHRRAEADFGSLSPAAIRAAQRYYGPILAQRKASWRQRNSLSVRTSVMPPYGKQRDGVRRSAF